MYADGGDAEEKRRKLISGRAWSNFFLSLFIRYLWLSDENAVHLHECNNQIVNERIE